MERSFKVAGARFRRLQAREIAEDLLLPARDQRIPILQGSRTLAQGRLEPRRHRMLRAVPVPRIDAELEFHAIADLRPGCFADVAVQVQIEPPVAHRHHIDAPRHRGLAVDTHENRKRLAPAWLDGFCLGRGYEDVRIALSDFYDGSEAGSSHRDIVIAKGARLDASKMPDRRNFATDWNATGRRCTLLGYPSQIINHPKIG